MSATLTKDKLAKIVRTRLEHLANDFPKGPAAVLRMEAEAIEQVINDWPPFETLAQQRAETVRSQRKHDGNPSAIAPRLSSKKKLKK